TLPEADCMFHGDNFDEFIKVSKKKTRGIVSCSLANISAIPHPRYCNLTKHTTATVPIFFSKGCTKTCKFCADKITYCRRPEEEIVKEILYIVKRFKVNRFYVCDLIINNDIGYLASLAQKLASLPVKLRFTGSATMDKRMDFGFFRLLRKAGFHELCFGVESLSDNVLHLMGKDYSAADAMANIKDAKMAGLSTQVNFMVGFPGEHDEDIGITIEKLEDCNSYIDNVSNLNICSLEPGAPILAGDLTGFYDTKKEMEWTFDGNTLEERQKRRERLMAACEKNNLTPSWTQNIMPKESI
ncbi:MAG: radical SAM protein, partial [Nanoarchaeota archaeon]|nr:radical SAM protein [Nanoarchaeota archaeon]